MPAIASWSIPSRSRRPANSAASARADARRRGRAGPASPASRRRTSWSAGGDRRLGGVAALGGLRGQRRLDARLELLPHARDGDQQVRAHRGQVARDLARVGARRRLVALGQRHRVVQDAVHHVRGRQPRDDPPHVRDRSQREPASRERRHDAGVRELDALRLRGRPRGVDQRRDAVGSIAAAAALRGRPARRAPRARERPATGAGHASRRRRARRRGRGALQREQRALDHDDPRARVARPRTRCRSAAASCTAGRSSRRTSSRRGRRPTAPAGWSSSSATVSPGRTPSARSAPAAAATRSASSAQVSAGASSSVRTATAPGVRATVSRKAPATVAGRRRRVGRGSSTATVGSSRGRVLDRRRPAGPPHRGRDHDLSAVRGCRGRLAAA